MRSPFTCFNKALTFAPAIQHIRDDPADEKQQQPSATRCASAATRSSCLLKMNPRQRVSDRPQQGASTSKSSETAIGNADHARQRRCGGVEAGNELADQQRARPQRAEVGLGAADAGIGLERDAAKQVQDHAATPFAERSTRTVSADAGERWHTSSTSGKLMRPCASQRARGQQQRRGRNRQATLLDQHPAKEQGVAVLHHELERLSHRAGKEGELPELQDACAPQEGSAWAKYIAGSEWLA